MTDSQQTAPNRSAIAIRRCTTHAEYRTCVDLQIAVWNFDPLDTVSSHILAVAAETGGQIFGAFDGERMVGFSHSFVGGRNGMLYLHSHMLAVLPEYRNHGVGRLLKMAQRDDALARGINLIEWTFDPLQLLNAYFNIMRLGAVIRRYIPDFYGNSSSPLHANLPTDRLVAEWWLDSPRVHAHLAGKPTSASPGHTIEIPRNMAELRSQHPSEAIEVQKRVRRDFQQYFREGYLVTGFTSGAAEGSYLFERTNAFPL